jgi:hypothetical protein
MLLGPKFVMIIRTLILCAPVIHLCLAESSARQSLPRPDGPASIHSQVEALSKELGSKENSLAIARAAEKDRAKRRVLADQQLALGPEYAKKFLALADLVPGQSTALEPLCAAVLAEYRGPEAEIALERLRRDCASNPDFAEFSVTSTARPWTRSPKHSWARATSSKPSKVWSHPHFHRTRPPNVIAQPRRERNQDFSTSKTTVWRHILTTIGVKYDDGIIGTRGFFVVNDCSAGI